MAIFAFELIWTSIVHAPCNSHFLGMVAKAFPHQSIRVVAEQGHLSELQKFSEVSLHNNFSFEAVQTHADAEVLYRPHIVSFKRFRYELGVILHCLESVPRSEPILIIQLSCTSTAIFAAHLAGFLSRRRVMVQALLHGDLNSIDGWRSRNPLVRRFDLCAVLTKVPRNTRFVTYEAAIARELKRIVPQCAAVIDTVSHHTISSEFGDDVHEAPQEPLRVGLVGGATEEKGITPFLELARIMRQRYGRRIEFHLVGASSNLPPERLRDLAQPIQPGHISRAEFTARLGMLHYVMLPLELRYYRLSASGALIDAVTWLKPIIATRIPIVEDLFASWGDIGYLCDDIHGMQAVLEEAQMKPNPERYLRQVEALRALRASRTPAATAPAYRTLMQAHFPALQ